jgi:hypothetical protein
MTIKFLIDNGLMESVFFILFCNKQEENMHLEDHPYLRDVPIEFKNGAGGFAIHAAAGGTVALTTEMDENGDKGRIQITRVHAHYKNEYHFTFRIQEPNLHTLRYQWKFLCDTPRFPDRWRRNNSFGYNSVISAHFCRDSHIKDAPHKWKSIALETRLQPKLIVLENENGKWGDWKIEERVHGSKHRKINKTYYYWNKPSLYERSDY